MKSSAIPILCSVALVAMVTAGLSHWWSVRQFVIAVESGLPVSVTPKPLPASLPAPVHSPVENSGQLAKQTTAPTPARIDKSDSGQKEFYEALISKMNSLQTQNRDLLDQLAETNRDVMKLEFRVDTHSESFRPMPVSEDRSDTGFEQEVGIGVLPPRAQPIELPDSE